MSYHFLVFTDGIPLGIHNHQTPIAESYYVYAPPQRSKPYVFKAGKHKEAIYAILFPMSDKDRDQTNYSSQWSKRMPERLEPTIALFDLMFSKSVDDYAKIFMELSTLYSDDLLLVTECGVRGRMSLTFLDSAVKSDCVIAPKGQNAGSVCFMNIVEHNLTKHKLPKQEAFDNACATNVLGDYLYAITPRWWVKAFEHYGTEKTRKLSTTGNGSKVLRSDVGGLQASTSN